MSGAADAHRALLGELAAAPIPTRDALADLSAAIDAFGADVDRMRDALDLAATANSLDAIMSAAVAFAVVCHDMTARVSAIITRAQVLRDSVDSAGRTARNALADALNATGAPHAETETHRAHLMPQRVHVVTGPDLPAQFWRDRSPIPDRLRVRGALEAGEHVPGAALVPSPPSIRIEVRKP